MTTRQQSVYVVAADGSGAESMAVVADANLMGWTPDGGSLLFRRERHGQMGLHVIPISNGRAAGDARKLHAVTNVGNALSVTPDGTLIHGKVKRITEAVFTSLDPESGTIGPLEVVRPVAGFGPGGMSGGVRFSPDGRHVLYTTTPASILLRAVDGRERTVIPQMMRVGRIEWSADSTALLIAGAADESAAKDGVYRVDLQSGAATLLFAAPAVGLLAPSPDGRLLYYRSGDGAVTERQMRTGAERALFKPEGLVFDMKLSRDGSQLSIVGQNTLSMVDLRTGVARARHVHSKISGDKFWGGDWTPDGRRFLASVSVGRPPLGPKELWTFPADDGPPLRHPLPFAVRGVWVSGDGTQLALVRSESLLQVWALENVIPRSPAAR